jgi:hypothetical protein
MIADIVIGLLPITLAIITAMEVGKRTGGIELEAVLAFWVVLAVANFLLLGSPFPYGG